MFRIKENIVHLDTKHGENILMYIVACLAKQTKQFPAKKNQEKARQRKTTSAIKERAELAGELCGARSARPHWSNGVPLQTPARASDRNSLFTCFYGRHFVTFARAAGRANPYSLTSGRASLCA